MTRVKICLQRTICSRGPSKGYHDIKKTTISIWVKFTIQMAYKSITKRQMPFFKVRAHKLRALSASWAYINFIPLEEIVKAGVCSISSTFAKFCLKGFQEQRANFLDFGQVVVVQKVVYVFVCVCVCVCVVRGGCGGKLALSQEQK